MLYLLSPAKKLDFETPLPAGIEATLPAFMQDANALATVLKGCAPHQLASLMRLSDKLASLNAARYAAWQDRPARPHARPALFAFDGDVYRGLDATTLDDRSWSWLQAHACILSGLYGVLRPLDAIQAHRLEMGTRLETPGASDLYQFWGDRIALYLNGRLQGQAEPVIINLASQEYFKSVDRSVLAVRLVDCVFQDEKAGRFKIVSFYAKRARGMMLRYAAQTAAQTVADLRGFELGGYAYAPEVSSADRLVFRRSEGRHD